MQALTAAMAGWVELRGPTRVPQPRRLAMPDPAAAPLTLAPAAQRTEWVDVVIPEGVEKGKKFSFEYGGMLYKARATVAAGQAMRLPALMFADEGGGAAAEAETAVVAGAVAGAGADEGTEAGAGAVAEAGEGEETTDVATRPPLDRGGRRRMARARRFRDVREAGDEQAWWSVLPQSR